MHVLAPLQFHLLSLADSLTDGRLGRVTDRVGMLLPHITAILNTARPVTPDERARWDRYAGPALAAVRKCETLTRNMPWPVTRSGLTWSPLWLTYLLADLALFLTLPGLDDLFDTPPSIAKMPVWINGTTGERIN